MSNLPSSWRAAPIRDLTAYVQRGKSPRYAENSDLPVVNQKCVRWSGLDHRFLKFVAREQWDAWGEERSLRQGDILWNSTGTGTIGRAALFIGLPAYDRVVADSHVTVVRTNSAVEPHYLLNFIKSPSVQSRIEDMQAGSTNQVELAREEVLSTIVPLAPLTEQHRIVAKIDSLSAKSARARDHLDNIPRLVEMYKQAVLAAAFRGELSGGNANEFKLCRLATVVESTFYGPRIAREAYVKSGVPTLRTSDIAAWGQIALDDPPQVNVSSKDLRKWELRDGDLIITRTGATIGKCAVYEAGLGPALPSAYLIRVRLKLERIASRFALLFLLSPSGQDQLLAGRTAVAQPNINADAITSVLLPLPAPETQRALLEKIEASFTWIDRLAKEATSARKLVDHLDQAVLAKAFRGKLVPQDPADEPASVLLERIRAERAGAPAAKRRGRPRAPA